MHYLNYGFVIVDGLRMCILGFSDVKYMVDRAFINTCLRLDNAVKILQAFAMQRIPSSGLPADDIPRDLSKMATKVFQGLRAVYAVSNPCNHVMYHEGS